MCMLYNTLNKSLKLRVHNANFRHDGIYERSSIMVPDICTINDFQPLLGTLEIFPPTHKHTHAHTHRHLLLFSISFTLCEFRKLYTCINVLYHITDCDSQHITHCILCMRNSSACVRAGVCIYMEYCWVTMSSLTLDMFIYDSKQNLSVSKL